MPAKSVIDKILNESDGSYEDMLAKASQIVGKANELGVSPEVVAGYSASGSAGKDDPFASILQPQEAQTSAAALSYALGRRSEIPSSGIAEKVAKDAQYIDPAIQTVLFSGQEPAGANPVGTPYRHPLGYAGDFKFKKDGELITDPGILRDIALRAAANDKANVGYAADGSYMSPSAMHIDTMPVGQGGYPGGHQWGNTAKQWAADLEAARASGKSPLPRAGAPLPRPRPEQPPGPIGMSGPTASGSIGSNTYSQSPETIGPPVANGIPQPSANGSVSMVPQAPPQAPPQQMPQMPPQQAPQQPPAPAMAGNGPRMPLPEMAGGNIQQMGAILAKALGGGPNQFGAPTRQGETSSAPGMMNDPQMAMSNPQAIAEVIKRDGWNSNQPNVMELLSKILGRG